MNDKVLGKPIDELYTDSGPVDPRRLVSALKPYIQIKRDSGDIFLTGSGSKLPAKIKILIYFLTKKIMKIDGVVSDETVSAKEIKDSFKGEVAPGTVDSYFKSLREGRIIIGKGEVYELPNSQVSNVLEILEGVN